MNIVKKQDGSTLLFEIEGSIDSTTSNEFNETVNKSLDGIETVILDFGKVDYISSAGLRVLLVTSNALSKQGKMIIRHPNSNVMDIFSMTGFDNILNIEE